MSRSFPLGLVLSTVTAGAPQAFVTLGRLAEAHGGTITALDSAGPLRQAADAVLVGLGLCGFDVPVQARVDLVRMPDGSFALLELELIEPSLYLRMDPKAPANFADAVERWLRPQRGAARTGPQSRARG